MLRRVPGVLPCLLLAVFGLSACSDPPRATPGALLGYGTPGVEAYAPAGQAGSLDAELARCQGMAVPASPPPQTLEAACDQLRRTVHNQPGNAATP